MNKKFKKRINFKKYRIIKKNKKSKKRNKLFFKLVIIFTLLIFTIFIYKVYDIIPNYFFNFSEESNYDWKKNAKEIINKQISILNGETFTEFNNNYNFAQNLFNLAEYNEKENSIYNLEIKEKLIQKFSRISKKDFRLIKKIVIVSTFFFGNQVAALNNVIYYCEILGIKNLYFNSKFDFYVKNDIITDKIHISVQSISKFKCSDQDTFCGHLYAHFYFPVIIKPKRSSIILKDEIHKNLPKIKVKKDDLYIYIRAGDSFGKNGNEYTPAPYCFYERVITKFKFNDIYIISKDDRNPIIGKLLSNFPKIKHKLNQFKFDIALLVNAYNLVNSVSSFTQATISFDDNLENLFDYETYKITASILHFHYDIDKLNKRFYIYRMKPSKNYFRKMFGWKNSEEQRKLLFEENCINNFIKTKY